MKWVLLDVLLDFEMGVNEPGVAPPMPVARLVRPLPVEAGEARRVPATPALLLQAAQDRPDLLAKAHVARIAKRVSKQ